MADEKIEQRNNTRDNPVNWGALGINTEGFKGGAKKEPTDRPPEDLNQADLAQNQTKLPPQIIEHNDEGTKSTKHSADDERFDNHQLTNLQDDSINKQTPMKINSETSQDPEQQKRAEAERNPPQENKPVDKPNDRVNTTVNTAANTRPVTTQGPAAVVASNVQEGAATNAQPVAQQNTATPGQSPITRPADANLTVR